MARKLEVRDAGLKPCVVLRPSLGEFAQDKLDSLRFAVGADPKLERLLGSDVDRLRTLRVGLLEPGGKVGDYVGEIELLANLANFGS